MLDKLLVLDTETTGLDCRKDQILQLSAIYYEFGKEVSKFDEYIELEKDYKNVALGALNANNCKFKNILNIQKIGTSTTRLSEKVSVYKFCDWLLELKLDRNVLVAGQNVNFDLDFIKQLFSKYNISDYDSVLPYRTYDTMSINYLLSRTGIVDDSSNANRGGSLQKIANKLKIDTTTFNLHNSLEDVKLTAKIIFTAEAKLKEINEFFNKNK